MSNGGELLLRVEHVKYRSPTASRSPIGIFHVYEDRVEWIDNASDDKLVIPFNDIRGQRVSPPNKSKTQLQICLHNDEQPTFVFLNPLGDKEVHVKERDLVKETLQQALIHHRQLANQAAARSRRYGKSHEMEAKKKLLEQDAHLRQLYKHLVSSKLISPQDFWCDYYSSKEANDDEKLGVSGGFLSTIAQSEGTNGVKLNLNVDTIQSIFKTYPAESDRFCIDWSTIFSRFALFEPADTYEAFLKHLPNCIDLCCYFDVEKKHLELVPHEMSEQQFWSKFFQSHYFHRERTIAPNPADPFSDCAKADDREMSKMLKLPISHKTLDFSYLSDDLKLGYSGNDVRSVEGDGLSNKALLVRRCNYHSGRVLMSTRESSQIGVMSAATDEDQQPSTSTLLPTEEEDIAIESAELQDDKSEEISERVTLSENNVYVAPSRYSPQQYRSLSAIIQKLATQQTIAMEEDDDVDGSDDLLPLNDEHMLNGDADGYAETQLSSSQLSELAVVHDALAELLKHFWMCIPPTTPELETKLDRMVSTLKNFEASQLAMAETNFGSHNIAHCRDMLDLAYKRYDAYARK